MNQLVVEVQKKLRRGENVNILVTGKPGKGKTTLATSLALAIDPTFNRDKLKTGVVGFLDASTKHELEKYTSVVFDEYGVAVNSRNWASKNNKAWIDILQSFREMNLCVIFTVPSKKLIDSNTSMFIDYEITCFDIDRTNEIVICALYENQYNERRNRTYPKAPIRKVKEFGGRLRKMPLMLVGFPPKDLHDAIREKVNVHKRSIQEESQKRLTERPVKKEKEYFQVDKFLPQLLPELSSYLKFDKGKWIVDAHKLKLKLPRESTRNIALVKVSLENSEEFKQAVAKM